MEVSPRVFGKIVEQAGSGVERSLPYPAFTIKADETVKRVSIKSPYGADYAVDDDPVNHPSHYQLAGGVEVIDLIRYESYLRGNVFKYMFRAPYKGKELEDLRKARKYLDWEIERLEKEQKGDG